MCVDLFCLLHSVVLKVNHTATPGIRLIQNQCRLFSTKKIRFQKYSI